MLHEINLYGEILNEQMKENLIQRIALAKEQNHQIIIDLGATNLTNELLSELLPFLTIPEVTELRLDDNPALTNVGISELCETLKEKPSSLKALSLCNINLGLDGALTLAELLKDYSLESLDLSSCQIPADGIQAITISLVEHQHLQHLNLNSNPVRKAITALGDLLQVNRKLQRLYLAECQLEESLAAAFVLGIKQNGSLKEINISANELSNQFVEEFAQAIQVNNTLTKYHGPDTAKKEIAHYCYRNELLPSNARWLNSYNPEASTTQRSIELIVESIPPTPSLCFISGRKAVQQGTLTPGSFNLPEGSQSHSLATVLFEGIYEEAAKHVPPYKRFRNTHN
ncbi:hypothetical protein [Candidatus Berkiella aquae]|uniref:Leucine Rich repeats (2 copies) n=1 Tax=Candidatus Berkiella aquae TaxID=295108 RepID=A0A0Q9YPG9_9GAMM|nr:hypothetical protein [Candidatus Berkiella aquae]MCS5711928.1 hypothetical protein [Candidatus Berkiella aquae]